MSNRNDYYELNKERIKKYQKSYHNNNIEERIQYSRDYYQKNKKTTKRIKSKKIEPIKLKMIKEKEIKPIEIKPNIIKPKKERIKLSDMSVTLIFD